MSYILEALRRAERERQMGKATSMQALTPPAAARTGLPRQVWILAAATLLIAVAALFALFRPRPAGPPPAPAPAPAESVRAEPVPAAAAPAPSASAPATPAPPASRELTPAIEDRDELASLDDVTQDGAIGHADDDALEPKPKPEPEPQPQAAPLQPQDFAIAPTETQAAVLPTPGVAAPNLRPAPDAVPGGVTALRDMPPAYREQFPVRSLEVHVYDPDPARRWIMVDGRRYREEQVVSGARIVEITDNGVVFDYDKARVLLPVR